MRLCDVFFTIMISMFTNCDHVIPSASVQNISKTLAMSIITLHNIHYHQNDTCPLILDLYTLTSITRILSIILYILLYSLLVSTKCQHFMTVVIYHYSGIVMFENLIIILFNEIYIVRGRSGRHLEGCT